MNSAVTVVGAPVSRKRRRRSSVHIVTGDTLAKFARIAVEGRARRIFIASPWVSSPSALPPLERVCRHIERVAGRLVVITGLVGASVEQRAAVQDLVDRGAVVYELRALHAKVCVAELAGGRLVGLVGSANMTANSMLLGEAGVFVISSRRAGLGRELEHTVHALKSSATPASTRDLLLDTSATRNAGEPRLTHRRAS